MLRRFLKNRRGTAEIIGSALFIVIILFFFSNVYLWHDQATRVMNTALLERANASVSIVATDEGVNVTNNGGVTFALSRLWIIDNGGQESQHYYTDLENIMSHQISVVAGQTIQISLNFTAPTPVTGSRIPVRWDDTLNLPVVQYGPPEHDVTLIVLTEFGNTASCVVRASSLRPKIAPSPSSGIVGTLVTLSGSNFEPASLITVKYDGIPVPTYPAQAQINNSGDSSGAFSGVLFNIPASAFGNHILTVTDNGGGSANATLDVTSPSLTVTPASGSNGTSVTVSGNGFAANSAVTVTQSEMNVYISGITTTVTGSFTASFIIPPYMGNYAYTVTATDASTPADSASRTFTVVG